MSKKIIVIFVCTLLIVTMFPMLGTAEHEKYNVLNFVIDDPYEMKKVDFIGNGEVLDQYQKLDSGVAFALQPFQWIAQGFKPTIKNMTRLELLLYRSGDPPVDTIITVSIRNSLDGNDLTSTEIIAGDFEPNPKWVEFNLSDIQVVPEQTYYIVARSDCDLWDEGYGWSCRYNNPYDRGDAWIGFEDYYWIKLDFEDHPKCDMCFMTYGLNEAPNIPTIKGPTNGKVGTEYNYTITTTDYEGQDIWYYIKWGGGSVDEWIGPYSSGSEVNLNHTWEKMRRYTVKVKAKDIHDFETDWATIKVTIPKNKPFLFNFPLLSWLFDRFPNAFPILRYIVGL